VKAAEWSPDFDFPMQLPHENEKYIPTITEEIEAAGGLNEFWSLSKWTGLPTPAAALPTDFIWDVQSQQPRPFSFISLV